MKTCFGYPLRYGGIIIAVLELVGSILGIYCCIWYLILLRDVNSKRGDRLYLSSSDLALSKFGSIFLLILFIAQFIVSSLLLYGIQKKSLGLIQLWIIFKVLTIIGGVFYCLMTILWGTYVQVIIQVIFVLFNILCVIVIHDLHKEIELENEKNKGKDDFQDLPLNCILLCASM